ncbi:hypothetical protein RHSIM_Rhsim12G0118300 [Rhododendron simsii]|uniref:Uncharacterized protein n=1 Tax=Rhododendron simsii TaxID=118357 RepID=A0A834L971_RHOSS|nr:hypothetical protein RHSIM_Rhsim12G0118300 [Rhododendron simsii]
MLSVLLLDNDVSVCRSSSSIVGRLLMAVISLWVCSILLIDQALSRGGIAEAFVVLKRVGSHIYPGDGAALPLDTLCLHLEKAALGLNLYLLFLFFFLFFSFSYNDVARALLAASKGAIEPVLNTYDRLLSNGAILPSPIQDYGYFVLCW